MLKLAGCLRAGCSSTQLEHHPGPGLLAAPGKSKYSPRQSSSAAKGTSPMSTATETLKKVRVSMMNAIHDLPLLVARDEGFFRDEGLDVEILKTPGTAQRRADHQAL